MHSHAQPGFQVDLRTGKYAARSKHLQSATRVKHKKVSTAGCVLGTVGRPVWVKAECSPVVAVAAGEGRVGLGCERGGGKGLGTSALTLILSLPRPALTLSLSFPS